jgi:allantoinase
MLTLPKHNRYDYSVIGERKDYSWPGGKRLAFCATTNIEVYAYRKGTGWDPAKKGEPQQQRNYSWRDYGNRVGIWRLFDLFEQLKLPAAHNINSLLYEYHPQICDRIRQRGDEIVGHGRTNSERQADMPLEEERACIREAAAAIEKHEGKRPLGWLAPYISQTHASPDLLREAGFRYMMDWPLDDQPVWFRTRQGPILSIPYAHDLNDSLECVSRRTPSQLYCENLIDHFDEMLEESARRPLVMSVVLHSFILGQPHRLRRFRQVIEHIVKHRKRVWLTRPGEICRYIESLPAGVVPGN